MGTKKFALISLSVILTLAGVAIPAHAEDTGTISGTFLDDGVPVANAFVFAAGPTFQGTSTDSEGNYELTGLMPGPYHVEFTPQGGLTQWAFGKTDFFRADRFEVTAGATTVVNEERLEIGQINGSYVDRQGNPLGGVLVQLFRVDEPGFDRSAFTGPDGRFTIPVLPGRYRVEFQTRPPFPGPGAPFIQYAGGTDVSEDATIFTVAVDQTVTVNETRLPVGSMSGRFTDAAGNGMPDIEVSISRDDVPRGPSSRTDANGFYVFDHMWARSDWRVQFLSSSIDMHQYAFGTIHQSEADLITITEGQTTDVSDSKLPTGTVRVRVREAGTGLAVERFQATVEQAVGGETDTGELVLEAPIGTHPLFVYAYGFAADDGRPVTVRAGEETAITVTMQPNTRIETRVIDAVTGAPVAGVCLILAKPLRFQVGGDSACQHVALSSASGRVFVDVEPGWHQIMAMPVDASGYGAQWVGANAGSGNQLHAKLIEVDEGESAVAPVIKLDRAGMVTGQVLRADGSPAAGAVVSLGDWEMFSGGAGFGTATADEDGRYTADFLGPYQWPLRFMTFDVDIQWSGGIGNRHLAERINVQSGQTVNYDFRFRASTTLKPTVTGAAGDCYFFVYNALTGDNVGFHWTETCSEPFELRVPGPQVVKINVAFLDGDNYTDHWWGGSGFLTARPVIVPTNGSKNLTIRF